MIDYYAILQVAPNADAEVIAAAYRRLARKYHPDTNPAADAPARMRELNEAYEVLGDPAMRQQYDAARVAWARSAGQGGASSGSSGSSGRQQSQARPSTGQRPTTGPAQTSGAGQPPQMGWWDRFWSSRWFVKWPTVGIVAIMALVGLARGLATEPEWAEFTSSAGRFSVLMPGTPSTTSDAIAADTGSVTLHLVSADGQEAGYGVGYGDFPPGSIAGRSAADILNDARDGAVANVGGRVTSDTAISLSGYPGREIYVRLEDGAMVRARLYLVGSRLYVAQASTEQSSFPEEEARRFFDSFRFLAPAPTTAPRTTPAPPVARATSAPVLSPVVVPTTAPSPPTPSPIPSPVTTPSPPPSPTPASTRSPQSPIPSPSPGGFGIDSWVLMNGPGEGDCSNVRQQPSLRAGIVVCMANGRAAQIDDGPVVADGFRWWHTSAGGWTVEDNFLPPPPPALMQSVSDVAGQWWRHGFSLSIEPSGRASAEWRVYTWCDQDPRPPCDRTLGNVLVGGGQANIALSQIVGTRIEGRVLTSTVPQTLRVGPVTLSLLPFGMAELATPGQPSTVLCGPAFLTLAPQEVVDWHPCGA